MSQFDGTADNSYGQTTDEAKRQQTPNPTTDYARSTYDKAANEAGGQQNAGEQANRDALNAQSQGNLNANYTPQGGSTPYWNAQAQASQEQQAYQSVSTSGSADSGSRRYPKILENHPILTSDQETKDLLELHRLRRVPDRAIENHEGATAYYAEMAKIDPSSATFDPPPHVFMPMPRGGLDTIVAQHLGRPPLPTSDDMNQAERQKYASALADYQEQAAAYKHLLYRFNSDLLQSDDRYRLGQPIRVFTEGLL